MVGVGAPVEEQEMITEFPSTTVTIGPALDVVFASTVYNITIYYYTYYYTMMYAA